MADFVRVIDDAVYSVLTGMTHEAIDRDGDRWRDKPFPWSVDDPRRAVFLYRLKDALTGTPGAVAFPDELRNTLDRLDRAMTQTANRLEFLPALYTHSPTFGLLIEYLTFSLLVDIPSRDDSQSPLLGGSGNEDSGTGGWFGSDEPPMSYSIEESESPVRAPFDFDTNTNTTHVRLFYATDREPKLDPGGGIGFGRERSTGGKLHFGNCRVSIPKKHKVGHLESPSILRLEFSPNPERHIVLLDVENLEEEQFLRRLARAVSDSPTKEAFIFVHGYNVTFEDAARRAGQFAFDLHFVGAPILYSWPAAGQVLDYSADESNVIWTAPHFERFLTLIAQHSGAKRIHVIAHSMGNRAVCDALKALSYRNPEGAGALLHHLVLAAPDIDADTFRELAASLKRMSGHITLYSSSKDKAIQLSQRLHKNPRAGAPPPLIVPGVECIDASEMGTDFLLHSYFSDNWPLLSDIHELILDDKPAAKRFGIREAQAAGGTYYVFRG